MVPYLEANAAGKGPSRLMSPPLPEMIEGCTLMLTEAAAADRDSDSCMSCASCSSSLCASACHALDISKM